MGPVAQRGIGGLFAQAPPYGLFFGHFEFHGLQSSALVGAVAKRLLGGPPARTPPMRSRFNFKRQRLPITNQWFFSHRDDNLLRFVSMRDENWSMPRQRVGRHGLNHVAGFRGRGCHLLFDSQVSLRRQMIHEGDRKPRGENDRRSTDKMTELHRNMETATRLRAFFVSDF